MYKNATESGKFNALNGIAETNKRGNRLEGNSFVFDGFPLSPARGADYSPRASIFGFS